MSFHGGLVGVVLAIWLFCRRRKLNLLAIGDLVCSGGAHRPVLRAHRQFHQ